MNNHLAGAHKAAQWYAVNTNPRCEALVCKLLGREDFEVFFPTIETKKKLLEPLFPGYLFVRLNLKLADWVKIKYLHGVRKIVSFGGAPVPVHDQIISAILTESGRPRRATSLTVGDKVRFTRGPFAGLEGKFTGDISGKQRVRVLLEAMERVFTVEVEEPDLSKVG